ncbi:hypothetical protein [Xylanimonas ulmi]|uniref:Putative membrane protein n=1 Tax=Xylanimonas ulmi TaxID=228973 RepID=A0A4Q7M126_9MICO|nr:hypothetical protein [Xylanibacterium ulmi]RZS60262.1 putative membrane protein [Xylanibacterium ulmi]
MSDPFGTTPTPDPNEPRPPAPPTGPPSAAAPPPYGQAAPPPYGPPAPPQYPQPGGFPTAPPATPYGEFAGPLLRVGDALRFAWAKFQQNALAWVLFMIITAIVTAVLNGPSVSASLRQVQSAFDGDVITGAGPGAGALLLQLVALIVGAAVQVFAMSTALREADGSRPRLGAFFSASRLGPAIVVAVLVSIAASIAGALILLVGGLVLYLFAAFAVPFVLDRGLPVFGAIGESFRVVGRNFGPMLLLLLALIGINILGAIPLGLGLLVTLPLSALALAYAFRRLTGGTIV